MENQNLLSLLEQLDVSRSWEYPKGFNYQSELAKFQRFVAALKQVTSLAFQTTTGQAIQDAPFHSQVHLLSFDDSPLHQVMRFSNFGDLAAIADEDLLQPTLFATLVQLLVEHGYTYIPEEVYYQKYTGRQVGIDPINTWWDRFFDWI